MSKQKREKRNFPEFVPPEKQFIERVHKKGTFSEAEIIKITNIKKHDFKNLLLDYLYEINFPKESKLQEINFLSTSNIYSITFPGSLAKIMPNSFRKCEFLQQIMFSTDEHGNNNLTFIGDHAFDNTIIQTLILPEKIKQIGSFCFPHTLKEINFENGTPYLEKVHDNAFKNTQIESIILPLNIKPFIFSKNIFAKCKKLKTFIFDHYVNKNQPFRSNDKEESENDKINDLSQSLMLSQTNIEKLELFVININYFLFYNTSKLNEITIPKSDNGNFIKYDGCLYTKNKKLIVSERNVKNVRILSQCQIITNYAFNVKSLEKVSINNNSQLKKISFLAFYESKIKNINLPDSVELIDYGAFLNCINLESFIFPNSINCIDFLTFSFTKLREITIPKNVTNICYGCFLNCSELKSVIFENGSNLIEIGDLAFSNTKIEKISLPKMVKKIGHYCFYNCHDLKIVEFDTDKSDLIEFGTGCFQNTQIEIIEIPHKIEKIYSSIFSHLSFESTIIKKVSIPSNIKNICSYAFYNCVNLTEVNIIDLQNSKLEYISKYAFCNCNNLTNFELPEKVKSFGCCSFKNCFNYNIRIKMNYSHNKINISESAFENSGIILFNSIGQPIIVKDFAFKNCQNLIEFSAVTKEYCIFGSSIFVDCNKLNKVCLSIDAEYVRMGKSCFMNSSIKTFEVPTNLKVIPKECFKNCSNLSTINIHENSNLIQFSTEAFAKSGLEFILIPLQTKKIKKFCFSECKKMKKITFSNNLQKCKIYYKAFYMSGIKQINIPKGIDVIDKGCFQKCENLKQVTFEENSNITKINSGVFKSSGIESIITPSSVSFIEKSAFKNCQKLKKVTFLGDKVSIFPNAFVGCINLNEVQYEVELKIMLYVPDYLNFIKNIQNIYLFDDKIEKEMIEPLFVTNELLFEKIELDHCQDYYVIKDKWLSRRSFVDMITTRTNKKCFYYIFEKLNNVYYTKKRQIFYCDYSVESINIPKETEIIHLCAFRYTQLKKVDFEKNSNLKIIDSYAFEKLQIEEISLPDSLVVIGNWSFNHCHNLKKVNISQNCKLEIIGQYAFCGTAIESIVLPTSLTTINYFAFYECFMLKTVDIYSNKVEFKNGCFQSSSIENIKFPQESILGEGSFKHCNKLKHLKFLGNPTKIIFDIESFAFSGLEEIKIKFDAKIEEKAFMNCKSLKKINISGKDSKFEANSFANSNIESLIFENEIKIINDNLMKTSKKRYKRMSKDPMYFSYFNDILKSAIPKISLNLVIKDKKEIFKHELYLNHNCYVVNNTLVYADLINNSLLFEKQTDDEIEDLKKNEILRIPSNAKRLDFPPMLHIKKIIWGANNIVEDLGPSGFFSYYNLTQIIIPKLVKIIPSKLFEHCHYLTSVSFEKGSILEVVGDFSFAHTRVSKVILPNTVQRIGKSAFYDNKNLIEVVFKGQIIDDEAFSNTGIKSFKLSNNTTKIGSYAFQYCHSLSKFEIDYEQSNLYEIGKYAFSESSIDEIKIPSKVEIINEFTFNGCKYLKNVFISNNSKLERIEKYSFAGNLSLESINLPKTIKKISYKAFINTPSLQSIMNESNQRFQVIKNHAIYKNNKSLVFVPRNLQQFEVISKCTIIHSGSFCGPNLNKVILQNNDLLNIESLAFAHCTKLKEITIPKSVEKIGDESFIGCESLEKVEFESPCKIKEITRFCFAFCGLKSINLPKSIEIINHSSFYFCQNLKSINLNHSNVGYVGDYAFSSTNIQKINFPTSINFIGNNSFSGNKSLLEIDFSNLADVKESDCQTKKEQKEMLMNCRIKSAHQLEKHALFDVSNNSSKITKTNNSDKKLKLGKIRLSSSQSKLPTQKPTIFKPSPKTPPDKARPVSPSNSAKSFDNQSPKSPRRQFRFSIQNSSDAENELNDNNEAIPQNDPYETIKMLQETIRKLQKENNLQAEIIKDQKETIKKQAELIRKLTGNEDKSSTNQIKTVNQDNHVKTPTVNKNELKNDDLNSNIIDDEDDNESINPNSLCFVHKNAFCNISANIFKFNLKEYKWFSFFDHCNKINEYIANNNIHLKLEKLSTSNIENYFTGNLYKITQMKWENQEKIPVLRDSLITEFSIMKMTKFLHPFHFSNCYKLTQIEFEKGINIPTIPKKCFEYTSLKKITIPTSVCSIRDSAFFHCSQLEEVHFQSDSKLQLIGENAFCRCEKLNKINLPNNIEIIANNCFSFTSFESIEIPSSVKRIDSLAFYSCKKLSKVVLNDGLQEICDYSFAYNDSLQFIELPDTLTKIKWRSFYKCSNLKEVKTTENTQLVEIYNDAFNSTQIEELFINKDATILPDPINMPHLNKITFYKGKPSNFIQFKDGTIYEKDKNFSNEHNNDLNISEIEGKIDQNILKDEINSNKYFYESYLKYKKTDIDKTNENYDNDAFNIVMAKNQLPILRLLFVPSHLNTLEIQGNCLSLSKSVIERIKNFTSIEYSKELTNFILGFSNCNHYSTRNINTIKILGNYSYISNDAFSHFESLEVVEFGPKTNILLIQKNTFLGCIKLHKIIIPSSCISIEEGSFKDCINLKIVEIGEKIKYIRKRAFYNCNSLESIIIPSSVMMICEESFMNCSNLKNVKFIQSEKGLETIGKRCFKNCTSLKSFVLPNSCLIIGNSSFMNCTSLEKFEYEGKQLFSIQSRAFFNCNSLKSFEISNLEYLNDNVRFSIESKAFMNCYSLKKIIIENYSKQIDTLNQKIKNPFDSIISDNAFSNCTSLTNANFLIGHSCRLGYNAFMNCSSLKQIVTNVPSYNSIINDNHMSFNGCPKDLKLDLFNLNKKVGSFIILVKELGKSSKKLLMNHLSTLNKDLFLWEAKDNDTNDKKLKVHSTVLNSFDGPAYSIRGRYKEQKSNYNPGPGQYNSSFSTNYYYNRIRFSFRQGDYTYNPYRVATEYNYTIPTPKPPLNI